MWNTRLSPGCPSSSLDVPDDQTARLVILRPTDVYRASNQSNAAMTAVTDILNNRGTTPRIYRNMVAFIAPEQDLMFSLQQTVRRYLAWKSIKEDSEDLNLDAAQNRETDNNLNRFNRAVDDQIKEAYCWLLIPYIDKATGRKQNAPERADHYEMGSGAAEDGAGWCSVERI